MSRFNTLLREDHLYIISDLHLGNPSFVQGKGFISFLRHLSEQNIALCINGDGLDLLQMSFAKLMLDFPMILKNIQNFMANGKNKIYYVVGNHDIYLEAFLEDSGFFNVVPFLDVVSGNKRIHIEHGHLYDRFFLYHPGLYTQLTKFAGMWLKLAPGFFHFWDKITQHLASIKKGNTNAFPVERAGIVSAAAEIMERGFDTVIFGHTHRPCIYNLKGDRKYANTGSWIGATGYYIEIKMGEVSLKEWKGLSM
jgi:UDP-2,3-diacylglucosamine pyrophosphatase LpxH